jgi:hypothetical protein
LLKSEDNETRRMVISALGELLTPASLEALHDHASRTENPQEAKMSRTIVENAVKAMNLSWAEYRGKTLPEKERLIKEVRVQKVSFGADERRLSREDLHRAAPLWIKGHRLPEWLKAKHLITGATPEDIDLLLEVKGAVLHRLSDECLYETRRIDDAIQWLGRSRYRKDPGVTERVEAR